MPEAFSADARPRDNPLSISKYEQRVLHVLGQFGAIYLKRMANGKARDVSGLAQNGHVLADCPLKLFGRL